MSPHPFSIIIPFDSHRGIFQRCLEAWTKGQTFPRDSFQIVIAAPDDIEDEILRYIESRLAPQDVLVQLPFRHDLELAAQAVEVADGEALFFTEAHCIPDSRAIELSAKCLQEHPEWAGFSGQSIPLTHNLLSEIEAEMYVGDIARNMLDHDWLKVLDQCLVLRADALSVAGGIEPEFDHFAEWVLAARLHEKGLKIGYTPEVLVEHGYVGLLPPLISFTRGFAAGEIKFAARGLSDPSTRLFTAVYLLESRHNYRRDIVLHELGLLLRAHLWKQKSFKDGFEGLCKIYRRVLSTARDFSKRSNLHAKLFLSKIFTHFWLFLRIRKLARVAFLGVIRDAVALGHQEGLCEIEENSCRIPTSDEIRSNGNWLCGWPDSLGISGFYPVEVWSDRLFQWCRPMATVAIWLNAGTHRVTLRWNRARPLPLKESLVVYCDGVPVEGPDLKRGALEFEATVRMDREKRVLISWICKPLAASDDSRRLGLPVCEVEWKADGGEDLVSDRKKSGKNTAIEQTENETLYFLHISKCAGTNLGLYLENAFPADLIAAPFLEKYYRREVSELQIPPSCRLVRGHYGWSLLDHRPDRRWKICTMLRHPLDRLVSLFRYNAMNGRLRSGIIFEEWVQEHLLVENTMTSFFIPGVIPLPQADEVRGIEAVSRYLVDFDAAARSKLQQCHVIGVLERFEDSLDLFSQEAGLFPPLRSGTVNRTSLEIKGLEISAALQDNIEKNLEIEYLLYSDAEVRFEADFQKLRRDLDSKAGRDLDATERRAYLRQLYLQEKSAAPTEPTMWDARDVYCGSNLGRREISEGRCHRWSGPEKVSRFQSPLPQSESGKWNIRMQFHPATPETHLTALKLEVNGASVEFGQPEHAGNSSRLEGHFSDSQFSRTSCDSSAFASFEMETPVRQGENEFRSLGVALQTIRIETEPV